MNYEKIVTLYDTAQHAEDARHSLEAAGFPPRDISMVTKKTLALAGQALLEPGLWHRLFDRDIEQHEATVYGRAVESGGVVLTVRVPESEVARAMGILNAHNVVDVHERAVQHGLTSATTSPKAAAATQERPQTVAAGVGRDEVLHLAEEQINVGKKLIQEGTTRIRRFVIEKPVEAQVTLHEEHAKVVRRVVTDPEFVKDIDWTDKTVEVTETAEEAVISKNAHITEEVFIGMEGTDHVETVRDKVRRQQIEVERIPGSDLPPKKR
jgi:stress response protein YsnF